MSEELQKENKRRFTLWVKPSVLALAEENHTKDNCQSVSEFIEKAITFYSGYVTSERNQEYLPSIIISTLKSIIRESDNRQNRNLFKLAVEMSMMMNVLATLKGVSKQDLDALRGYCVEEVKRLNGTITLKDAVEWQNS